MKRTTIFAFSSLKTVMLLSPFYGVIILSCAPNRTAEPAGAGNALMKGITVPQGFVVEQATLPGMVTYPMFATLDNNGRLFVIESSGHTTSTEDVLENPTFRILLLEDRDGDGLFDKRSVYADKLPYPMGGTFYEGSFYATVPPDVVRFTDSDGDNVADKSEVILSGWTLNHNAATLSGPFFGPDGWMYMCDARRGFNIKTKGGALLQGKGARIWRCRPDGTGLEWISGGGFDNTIELVFMPSGETIGTMTYFTDPQDGLRDALMHWVEGGVYPKPHPVIDEDKLKLTGDLMPVMTKLARVSPAGLMRYRSSTFGEEYRGNLFSAQFNTGRIMRHVISTDGATYRTADEPFLQMDDLELHPTDVLEDADGSLLVVNTGGWFIAGCPLSVTAKRDIHGGILRVRRTSGKKIDDPSGKNISFANIPVERLTTLLADHRPVVRDKALEQMIRLKETSVESFIRVLRSADKEEQRAAAVFALYRIGGPRALEAIRPALKDASVIVRTSAARVLGLARYENAVKDLADALKDISPTVRRQAATALGQIGDGSAVPALLEAAAIAGDRFTEHAIIYSLIHMEESGPMLEALTHRSANVRRAALIALDQIDGTSLTQAHIVPFLENKNEELQKTGAWVAAHHPEWGEAVADFLSEYLRNSSLTGGALPLAKDLLTVFGNDPPVQQLLASRLVDPSTSTTTKLLLLDALESVMDKSPSAKTNQLLAALLRHSDPVIQSRVLEVIHSHGISTLNEALDRIIADNTALPSFRMKALAARLMSVPDLSRKEFDMLMGFLASHQHVHIRQTAARLLTEAKLQDSQLLTLAEKNIADADAFLLPVLLDNFEGNDDERVGAALVNALEASTGRLDNISPARLEKILQRFPDPVQKSARPVLDTLMQRQESRLSVLEELEAKLVRGDVAEGRKLFFGKALCSTCHSVAGNGAEFGPDLTNIGEIRSTHDIIEAIVYPAASFAREYETSRVTTNESSHTGIIKEQLPDALLVETGPGVMIRIPTEEITSIESDNISMMPPGLDQQLSLQELSDLMAYLTTLPDGMGHLRGGR